MPKETGAVPDLAEVADRLAILDVLAKHSRGVDRADANILKSAYWPDAEVAYGGFNGPAHTFCENLPAGIRRFAMTHHSIGNFGMDIEGNDARVETYVTANHYTADAAGKDREMCFYGRYLDRMQKRGNVWKIIHRRVIMDWNQNFDGSAVLKGPPFDGLGRGDREPNDPVYRHLTR